MSRLNNLSAGCGVVISRVDRESQLMISLHVGVGLSGLYFLLDFVALTSDAQRYPLCCFGCLFVQVN